MNACMIQMLTATMPMGERIAYAIRMLVVGLGMVFVVLAILWGVLVLSRIFLYDMPARRKAQAKALGDAVARAAEPTPAVVAPAPAAPIAPAADDGALIAVITAAVAAAMSAEGTVPVSGFRVVSFRRASGKSSWNGK